MAALFGSAKLDDDIVNAPMPEQGEFSKGLRSGLEGAGSQLRSLAGGVGAALGADEFAAEQNQLARAQAERAAAAGPRVSSYRDVGSLRDAADYAAGLAGQAVPSVGLGVAAGALTAATGGGALPALAAGALTQLPFETGDVLQRQQQDPTARMRGAGENLRDAFLTGGASAVGQAIVPAALGGRLVGKGVQGALRAGEKEAIKTAGTGIGASVLRDAAIEGASEGAGELVKQQGVEFGAAPDFQAAAEGAVGGAIVGGGLGGIGGGADKFYANRDAMGDAVQRVAQKGTDAVKAAAAKTTEAADAAPVTDYVKRIKDAVVPKQDDAASIQSGGLSPDELTEAGNPTTPRARALELIDQGASKAAETTQRLATAFADRADIDPDTRAQFADAAANATDATKQAWVATQSAGIKAKDTFMKGVDNVIGALGDVKKKYGDKPADAGTAKKSEDFSGVREAIVQEVLPYVPESVQSDTRALQQVGEMVRTYIEAVKGSDLDTMEVAAKRMQRLFGDDTEGILTRVYDKVASNDPAATERFMANMQKSTSLAARDKSIYSAVNENLPEDFRGDARELADGLVAWARGEGRAANQKQLAPLLHGEVRKQIQQVFGKNTPKVMKALEGHVLSEYGDPSERKAAKPAGRDDDPGAAAGEDFGTMSEAGTDFDFYGTGKNRQALKVFPSVEAHRAKFPDSKESAADRLIKQLSEKYPDREVSFVPAREAAKQLGWSDERLNLATNGNPDDFGFVATKRISDPDKLGDTQVAKMKLDTDKHPNSPAKVKIGEQSFDAVAITKHFLKEGQGADSSDRGDLRVARAFAEGVAALATREGGGAINVPDSTVIGYQDGKPITFGETRKIDQLTEEDRNDAREIERLRKAWKEAASPEERAGVAAQAENRKASKMLAEGDSGDQTDILDGRHAVDPGEGNIHELAATKGVKTIKFNADGTPRVEQPAAKVTKEGKEAVGKLEALAERIGKINSPAAATASRRLGVLAKSVESLSDPDRRDLLQLANATKVSEVSETVNALAQKYKDVIAAPAAKKAEPKNTITEPAEVEATPEAYTPMDTKKLDDAVYASKFGDVDLSTFDKSMGLLKQMHGRWQELEAASKKAGFSDDDFDTLGGYREQFQSDGFSSADLGSFFDEVPQTDPQMKAALKASGDDFDAWVRKQLEGSPRPKAVAAKKAALDQAASSSDPALLKELRTTEDAQALQRTAAYLDENHPDSKAAQVAGEAFGRAAQDPDKSYSMQATNATQGPSWNSRQEAERVIQQSLGNSVAVAWERLPHAGEFDRMKTGDVIRLSVFGMNPKSVAYHESLHAFFLQLRDAGAQKVSQVLEKAASQPNVRRWMENHFKNEPAVLAQIRTDAEERAAYMYQLWASEPTFKSVLNPQATNFFGKVAEFLRSVLGIWSNDQRALHIMEHFESGEYAKNLGRPNTVALLGSGTNSALEHFKAMAEPLGKLGDSVFGAGSARLRDTDIAAIQKIADLIKPTVSGSENTETGYLAAARGEYTSRLNRFGESLGQPTKQQLQEALVALQSGAAAASPEARIIVRKVKDTLQELGGANGYLRQSGVDFGNLGPDYFPRVWDAETISKNQKGFLSMMDTYVRAGVYAGDPKDLMRKLIANDGNNFDVDTRQPGMQHTKERELSFITGQDAEPFLSKDLYQTMSSYISQATRRAEWAKRFGPDGKGLDRLMEQAVVQGATKEQIATTEKYLKGITGTLGDGINPEARRLMGNAIIYQNIRLLPLAIFSSVVDPMGIAVRGGTMVEAWTAFKRGVREIPQNFRKYDPNSRDASTLLAESLGTIENAALMHSLGALYSQGMTGSVGRKINDTFFRFNLMEQYNRSMRVAATESAISFITRHAAGADPKNSARWLAELNLDKSDVSLDANGRMKVTEADGLTKDQAIKVRDAINKWVDGAVLRPDQADKPIWFNDPHFALISHLKQFTYAFQHTIIDRVVREAKEGNYKPAALLSSYIPIMIAADYMKGFIQGGGEQPAWKRDWGPADYLWSGAQRAGIFGVGQFGIDAAESVGRGDSPLGSLAGPTVEQLGDAASVVGGRGQFDKFTLDSMPANALYGSAFKGGAATPDLVQSE